MCLRQLVCSCPVRPPLPLAAPAAAASSFRLLSTVIFPPCDRFGRSNRLHPRWAVEVADHLLLPLLLLLLFLLLFPPPQAFSSTTGQQRHRPPPPTPSCHRTTNEGLLVSPSCFASSPPSPPPLCRIMIVQALFQLIRFTCT